MEQHKTVEYKGCDMKITNKIIAVFKHPLNAVVSCDDWTGSKSLLKKVLPQSHFVDIRVRLNGKYYWFEGDFLKQIMPYVKIKQKYENDKNIGMIGMLPKFEFDEKDN